MRALSRRGIEEQVQLCLTRSRRRPETGRVDDEVSVEWVGIGGGLDETHPTIKQVVLLWLLVSSTGTAKERCSALLFLLRFAYCVNYYLHMFR